MTQSKESAEYVRKEKSVINLCAFEENFLGLIILAKTGVIWSNQAGGTACMQPRVEGLYIPLDCNYLPEEDPLLDIVENYDQKLIDNFLATSPELSVLFESVPSSAIESLIEIPVLRVMEAWIPVRVLPEPPDQECLDNKLLKDFTGKIGILTYVNSD